MNEASTPDDRIKRLLHQPRLLADFFRAFIPEVCSFADLKHIEYLDKEHPRSGPRPRRLGDVLVKTQWSDRAAAFLIHIESQHSPQDTLVERATEYAMRDSIRYCLPVMPVVLLTGARPAQAMPGNLRWDFGKTATIRVRCPVLQFQRMDPTPHLHSANVAALALTSLMKLNSNQQVESVVQTLAEALRQYLGTEELEAALEFVTASMALNEAQLLRIDEKVRTLASKEPVLSPMPQLINPFVEIGRIKGRVEGRVEGEQKLVLRLLQRRFPRAAKKAATLVRRLNQEDLASFAEALLFMSTGAECLAWLETHAK